MSIPLLLKVAALAVSIIGLALALEIATLTTKQHKPAPNLTTHHFSNMLGFFPTIIHRLTPKLGLNLGQTIATQMIDQTWLEKTGPKAVVALNMPLITTTSNVQKGLVKTYLGLFIVTVIVTLLALYF